jgi:hypothetical protein
LTDFSEEGTASICRFEVKAKEAISIMPAASGVRGTRNAYKIFSWKTCMEETTWEDNIVTFSVTVDGVLD